MSDTPAARLPVKLHRRVSLVLTEDAVLAEELLARKKLAQEVAGRLSDRVLLVRPGRVDAVLDELRKMGHTPQVVGRRRLIRTLFRMQSDPAWAAAVRAALARYDEPLLRAVSRPAVQAPQPVAGRRAGRPRRRHPGQRPGHRPPAQGPPPGPPATARRRRPQPPLRLAGRPAPRPARHARPRAKGWPRSSTLLDAGLAVPVLPGDGKPLRSWEEWLGAAPTAARVFVPPDGRRPGRPRGDRAAATAGQEVRPEGGPRGRRARMAAAARGALAAAPGRAGPADAGPRPVQARPDPAAGRPAAGRPAAGRPGRGAGPGRAGHGPGHGRRPVRRRSTASCGPGRSRRRGTRACCPCSPSCGRPCRPSATGTRSAATS